MTASTKHAFIVIALSLITNLVSITNKIIVQTFPFPATLSLLQTGVLLVGISVIRRLNANTFKLDKTKILYFSFTGIATAVNFLSTMKTLQFASLATLSVVHNFSLILVAVFDVIIFGKKFHPCTIFSIASVTDCL